jgi:hypothetical protein
MIVYNKDFEISILCSWFHVFSMILSRISILSCFIYVMTIDQYISKFFIYGLIKYRDTKTKFRHLKKLTCKGTLRQVFIRVYRLEIQSVMLVYSNYCPSYLLSSSPPPFPVC